MAFSEKSILLRHMEIHPSAIVERGAVLGAEVRIGPFCVVREGAEIGDRCQLESHVVVCPRTRMGADCTVHAFAVLGDDPQYVGFDRATTSGTVIGSGTVFREGATVHRSIYAGKDTVIGKQCYLMAYAHVAHDCVLEDGVVLTNSVLLAGHVHVGAKAYIGGSAAIHQYVRIGEGAVVGGLSAITMDVAPFLMVTGRDEVNGLNLVGLKRRQISREAIKDVKACFHALFDRPGNIREQAARLLAEAEIGKSAEGAAFLNFFEGGKRGFAGLKRRARAQAKEDQGE